jgi:CubicO group peptidase (beta-lactamase class C family)
MIDSSIPTWRLLATSSVLALTLAACSSEPTAEEPIIDEAVSESAEAPALESLSPFSERGVAYADARFAELIAGGNRGGVVSLFVHDGEVEHVFSHGFSDIETERPMTPDTLVRIASMTKPVTAVAILQLIEDGVLALDTPVSQFIPAFADANVATDYSVDENQLIPTAPLDREITIEDLLTHTSGVGYVFDYETQLGALYLGNNIYEAEGITDAERMDVLTGLPLYFQPGERWFYSYSNEILGFVVAEASGMSLEEFFQNRIFVPLSMGDTSFYSDRVATDDVSTIYTHDEDGTIVPFPTLENYTSVMSWEAGGAGLYSTATDYLKFAKMLANGGELDGTRILSADSVAAMTTVHVGSDRLPPQMSDGNFGMGYSIGVAYPSENGNFSPVGDFGWGGAFDTNFIVSPTTNTIGILMSQEFPGSTTNDFTSARDVFREVYYGALAPVDGAEG